jgi:centromeric protein E
LQQLTDALLEIEEERAIWSAKEKDALLAIEEQARSNNEHVTSLSTELSEVRIMVLLLLFRASLDKFFSKHM